MRTLVRWSFIVFIPLVGLSSASHAQWTNVRPNLLQATDTIGAMQFKDGIVWAGGNQLWFSPDSGKTWKRSMAFPADSISDIAFYDRLHGLVATLNNGFFITIDGGITWFQKFPKNNVVKVGYDGSNSAILALTIDALLYFSPDGGITWENSSPDAGPAHSFAVATDRTIYASGFTAVSGGVTVSKDFGQSWLSTSGSYNGDSWSIAVDSCDPELLYVANEESQEVNDNTSNFYRSSDGGQSWQITDSHTKPYLSGAMSTTADGIFLGARDGSGIHRSMDRGLTWKNIGGPNLAPDTRNLATIDDNIILAADTAGNIWLTTNGGGDSVQSAPRGALTLSPTQIFSTDTLACVPIQRSIQIIRSGCLAPHLISAIISGLDSASYQIDSVGNDSIYLTLFPQKIGAKNGMLIGQSDDGTFDTVQLSGFISPFVGTISYSSDSLFTNDTVHCDSLTLGVHLSASGCRPPGTVNVVIAGPDAGSYHIADSTSDSIAVIWTSQKPGAQTAWLVFQLSNGSNDSVALGGFSTSTPLLLSDTPHTLFSSDSLYVACDPATPSMIWIYDTACLWPNVSSEQIVGANAADYTISAPMKSPIVSSDSVLILFQPKDTGIRIAFYQLTLNDGTIISIPLSGVGLAKHTLSLVASSTTEQTDTIGGEVNVPITINGLARPEQVEIVLHYPLPDLDYAGSFDPTGTKVDVPGEQWPGRSLLRISNAEPGAVAAYARFNVFSDTDYQPVVTFDSLNVTTAIAPCEYSAPPAVTSTIIPDEGCGIQMLSQWIHLGKPPLISAAPNPTSGDVILNASADFGVSQIKVYDLLGMERGQYQITLHKNVPASLLLPYESGLYFLRIVSAEGDEHLSVMIER